MHSATRFALLLLTLAARAGAQQLDLFDPNDFVAPHLVGRRVIFVSRLVTGVSRGSMDQFRRVGQDVAFIHVANSLYWRGLQLDYKRTESRGENGIERDRPDSPSFARFGDGASSSPIPPPQPGSKNVTQVSWYQTAGERFTFRYRLLHASQFAQPQTSANVSGVEDRDTTRMAQLDAGMLLGARMQYLTLAWTELTRHSTIFESKQRTLTAGAFLPSIELGRAVLVPRLQLGGVAGEGAFIDIVNPSLELTARVPRIGGYVHVIYSPVYRDRLQHQITISVDRAWLILGAKQGN